MRENRMTLTFDLDPGIMAAVIFDPDSEDGASNVNQSFCISSKS